MKNVRYCPICRAPCEARTEGNDFQGARVLWDCPECRATYSTKVAGHNITTHPLEGTLLKVEQDQTAPWLKKINESLTGLVGIIGLLGLLFLVLGTKGCF